MEAADEIGLAVIAMLRASGVKKIIASDFSPGRRALAKEMGAHVVVAARRPDVLDEVTESSAPLPWR